MYRAAQTPLDPASRHELWRMQLLDELRGKLRAIDWEPTLDPEGRRTAALGELIARFEAIEAEELSHLHSVADRPLAAAPAPPSS